MPAKTDVKKKVLILGTGPDADEARQIADGHADVTVSTRFTANVTHLVVDETVKQSEPRLKRASSESIPVLRLAAFKELLGATDTEDEGKDAAEDTSVPQQAEAPAVEQDSAVEESAAEESNADESEANDDAPAKEEAKSEKVEDSSDTAEKDTAAEEVAEKKAESTKADSSKADSTKAESKKAKKPAKSGDDAPAKAVDESKPVGGSTKTEAAPKVGFLAKLKALFGKK